MQASHSCSVVFNPCLSDETNNELEAKWAVKHYELDISYGWMIFRAAFRDYEKISVNRILL